MSQREAIVVLGPQRLTPTLKTALDERGISGPIAVVTAGWEEREPEDQELRAHVGGEVRNLQVWQRCELLFRRDSELSGALTQVHDTLRKLQELYRIELRRALDAARELLRYEIDERHSRYLESARESAIATIRNLDRNHVERVAEVRAELRRHWKLDEREHVARLRAEIAQELDGSDALCIAGGHVAILYNRMFLCGVLDAARGLPIFAWSGGAMVLAERIVLFHDSPPQGPGDAEVLSAGFGIIRGLVPLPHAKRRLRLDDEARVALFARRFAPDLCVAFDEGTRADWNGQQWTGIEGTHQLTSAGRIAEVTVA